LDDKLKITVAVLIVFSPDKVELALKPLKIFANVTPFNSYQKS
jgi:hypothetical protein